MKLAIVICIALVPGVGYGQPEPQPEPSQADVMFHRGNDLLAAGKIAEACVAFDESQRLDPTVSNKLHQANCREKNNQLVTAWRLFLDAERSTNVATDDATQLVHKIAAERVAKLETRLSTLNISVPDPDGARGLEIQRNGAIIARSLWNKTVPVDGGQYTITARAPGNAEWSTTVTVGNERDVKTIEIPRLRPTVVAPIPDKDISDGKGAARGGAHSNTVPIALGVGAIVAGGAALGFDLWGDSTYNKAKTSPEPAQTSLWHSANDKRYVAEGFAVVGLGCAVAAVWLFLRGSDESPAPVARAGVAAQPFFAGDRTGIQLVGRW